MAQKTNPISLRLKRTNKLWNSCWYGDYNYTEQLKQDCGIRAYIQNISQQAKIAEPVVFIRRARQEVRTLFLMPKTQAGTKRAGQQRAFKFALPKGLAWQAGAVPSRYSTDLPSQENKQGNQGARFATPRKKQALVSIFPLPWTSLLHASQPLASRVKTPVTLGAGSFGKREESGVALRALEDWFCKIFILPSNHKTKACAYSLPWHKQPFSPIKGPFFVPVTKHIIPEVPSLNQAQATSFAVPSKQNDLFPYLLLSLLTGLQSAGCVTNKKVARVALQAQGAFPSSQGTPALQSHESKSKSISSIYALGVTMLGVNSGQSLGGNTQQAGVGFIEHAQRAEKKQGEWIWRKMQQVPHPIFPVAREEVAKHKTEPHVLYPPQPSPTLLLPHYHSSQLELPCQDKNRLAFFPQRVAKQANQPKEKGEQVSKEVAWKEKRVSDQSLVSQQSCTLFDEKSLSWNQGEERVSLLTPESENQKKYVNQKSPVCPGSRARPLGTTNQEKGVLCPQGQTGVDLTISTILPKRQVTNGVALKNHLETFLFQQIQGGCKVHYLVCPSVHQNPLFLASQIVFSLQERVPFRRLKHRLMRECSKDQRIRGVRINCSGRVATRSKKAQKARSESIQWGQTSLNVFSDFVHFASKAALTPFGKIGVKVWICYK